MKLINPLKRLLPLLFLTISWGSVHSMEGAWDKSKEEENPRISFPSRSSEERGEMILVEDFERKVGVSLNGDGTIPLADLLFNVFPNALMHKLKKAINDEKFIQCRLTRHYAESLIPMLNSPEINVKAVINYLNVIKMICEPGAAEGTLRNDPGPVGAELLKPTLCYMLALFDEVGASCPFTEKGAPASPYEKYLRESGGIYCIANQLKLRAHVDPDKLERVPVILTEEELLNYTLHHEFREAVLDFYKDYKRIEAAQKFYNEKSYLPDQDDVDFQKLLNKEPSGLQKRDIENFLAASKERLKKFDDDLAFLRQQKIENFEKEWIQEARQLEERKRTFYTMMGPESQSTDVLLNDQGQQAASSSPTPQPTFKKRKMGEVLPLVKEQKEDEQK